MKTKLVALITFLLLLFPVLSSAQEKADTKVIEFEKLMTPLWRARAVAQIASEVCQLRGPHWFKSISGAVMMDSSIIAKARGFSPQEFNATMESVARVSNQVMQEYVVADMRGSCERLRESPELARVDALQRKLMGKYL